MLRITVDDETLLRVRVATSPLWETLSSLALLARYRSEMPHPYAGWARYARRALPQEEQGELLRWVATLRSANLLSLVAPVPTCAWPALQDELAAVTATPTAVIRRQISRRYPAGAPQPLQQIADGGRDPLKRFAELVERYWQAAIAPYWRAMKSVLEEEILLLGRTLATSGAEAMLRELAGRVQWERPQLTLPHHEDLVSPLRGVQLYVVPVLFARGTRIFSVGGAAAAISYQSRGAAVFEGRQGDPPLDDRLAILVGRGRAAVMRALVVPTSTTSVAGSVGLAPSTVSQHLTALSAAGMVRRRRVGARVLYELDHGGLALLSHLDCEAM